MLAVSRESTRGMQVRGASDRQPNEHEVLKTAEALVERCGVVALRAAVLCYKDKGSSAV